MPNEVIYLTGAPAAGKSSVSAGLLKAVPSLSVWEYGQRLTAHLKARHGGDLDQAELRERSGALSTPEDIVSVDTQLIDFVQERRERGHVLIDSHQVTKERYGFRVTAYSLERFRLLAPTKIWMLYTTPEIAVARIKANAQGRPDISIEEARFHSQLQASVAVTYGMALGVPVHLFDADRPVWELCAELAACL